MEIQIVDVQLSLVSFTQEALRGGACPIIPLQAFISSDIKQGKTTLIATVVVWLMRIPVLYYNVLSTAAIPLPDAIISSSTNPKVSTNVRFPSCAEHCYIIC